MKGIPRLNLSSLISVLLLSMATIIVGTATALAQPGSRAQPSPTPRRRLPKPSTGPRGFEQYVGRDASKRLIAATATRPLDPANAYYQRGRKKHNAGRSEEAIIDFEQAIKQSPDWANPHYGLALSLGELGKLKEAIEEFNQVLKLTSQEELIRVLSHYYMGDAYSDLGDYGEAIEAYKEGIRLRPTLPKPHYNLGVAYVASGQLVDAISEFNQAVQLRVMQGSDYAEARYNLALAYLQLGKRREAEEQRQRLDKLNHELAVKLETFLN